MPSQHFFRMEREGVLDYFPFRLTIWVVALLTLIVSSIAAISVFKAVYLEKRDLKCVCVGGGSDVPLGFISLTENLMMMALAIWMMVVRRQM